MVGLTGFRAGRGDEAGFTLVELIAVLAILLIVISAVTASIVSGTHAEANVSHRQQAQADARAALVRMREDVHCSYQETGLTTNSEGGFTLALSLNEANHAVCAAVDSSDIGSANVAVQWCTAPDASHAGVFKLYRAVGACSSSTGVLEADDVVQPAAGWPSNSSAIGGPTIFDGNLWPLAPACNTGYLPSVSVDLATNPALTQSPNETYELVDNLALRNASRCGGSGTGQSLALTITAPPGGTAQVPISSSSVTAGLFGSGSGTPSGTITFWVFGPGAQPSTCPGGANWTQVGAAVSVNGNGNYNPTAAFTPASQGNYWWFASYSGDGTFAPTTSGCPPASETMVSHAVASPTVTVNAPASATVNVAVPASAVSAKLMGGTAESGALTFFVSGPSAGAPACPGAASWNSVGSATPAGDGTYSPSSLSFTPTQTGSYWWYVAFAGDSNNNAANSCPGVATTVSAGPDTFGFSTVTPTAGLPFNITITANLPGAGVDTGYGGAKCLTLSGAAASPNGTAPTYPVQGACAANQSAVTFGSGIATVSVTLFNAAATTLTAQDGLIAGSAGLTVTAGPQKGFVFTNCSVNGGTVSALCPSAMNGMGTSPNTATLHVSATDNWGNIRTVASALTVNLSNSNTNKYSLSGASTTIAAGASESPAFTVQKTGSGNQSATITTTNAGASPQASIVLNP